MEIKPQSFSGLSLSLHLVYFFGSAFDCKFIWKSYVNFSFVEVVMKDTYNSSLADWIKNDTWRKCEMIIHCFSFCIWKQITANSQKCVVCLKFWRDRGLVMF